jgi:hypothetical protein
MKHYVMTTESTKYCWKCKQSKPLDDFGRNRSKSDGLQSECKECVREYNRRYNKKNKEVLLIKMKEYRQSNIDKLRKRGREYSRSDKGRTARLRYYASNKEQFAGRVRKHNENHPGRYKARYQFRNAVKLGKIMRPKSCSLCGKRCKPHGHHEDYSKPFDVVWVCRKCHGILHRKERT